MIRAFRGLLVFPVFKGMISAEVQSNMELIKNFKSTAARAPSRLGKRGSEVNIAFGQHRIDRNPEELNPNVPLSLRALKLFSLAGNF